MQKQRWLQMLIVGLFLITACTPQALVAPNNDSPDESAADISESDTIEEIVQTVTPSPIPPAAEEESTLVIREAKREFSTDFTLHSVPYSDILSGGPSKDGIPALMDPPFESVTSADAWLADNEPVILIEIDDQVSAFPLQILMWHEIVNTTVGNIPIAVTFCPLCNTAIAFDRHFDDQVLDFGTTGRLRFSNLIMYDRQTETWWQQATGDAIVGQHTGDVLSPIPATIISWRDFRESYPDGDVLSRDTGYNRAYGQNPYVGYDDVNSSPFLFDGPPTPGQLPPMARVLTIERNDEAVAFPYDVLQEIGVASANVGGRDVIVIWQPGTASALNHGQIAQGDDVGTAAAFSPVLDGQSLEFRLDDGRIVDTQTNSTWNVLGHAIEGELTGEQLEPVVSINHFWFSWAAFRPETRIFEAIELDPKTDISSPEEPDTAQIPQEVDKLLLDFEVVLYQSDSGLETAQLSDIISNGRPTVLVFWAGLCPVCRREMPEIQGAYEVFGDQVNFIGIDVGLFTNLGSRDDALTMIDELGLTFTMGATLDANALPAYQVTGIPTTLFMKPDGLIIRKESTLLGQEALFERIETLISTSQGANNE